MNTICIPIKKKWFDMILSGEKKEEYREFKPYWVRRLLGDKDAKIEPYPIPTEPTFFEKPKDLETVTLINGYGHNRPRIIVELLNINANIPNPKWSPPDTKGYWFVLKLGKIIEKQNL